MNSGQETFQPARLSTRISLILAFQIYTVVWIIIVMLRYYSFNASVFDLGLTSNYLYRLSHSGFAYFATVPTPVPLDSLASLVTAFPYTFFPDPRWLVIFQSVWVGAGIFPLFRIVRRYTGSEYAGLLISVSYLLYYPLAGVNWFDFHIMSIFPTAFLFSVMYNMRGMKNRAVLFGVVAIISDYTAPFILLFYTAYLVLKRLQAEHKLRLDMYNAVIIGVSASVIALVSVFLGPGFTVQHFQLPQEVVGVLGSSAGQKMVYFYAMLLPVMFLAILGADFLAVGIPFFVLAFANSYEPYISSMFYQYPALIAPVIFISAAIGLGRLVSIVPVRKKLALKSVSTAFLVLNIIMFSFFTPIGNMYTGSIYSSHFGKYVTGTSSQYGGLENTTITVPDRYLSHLSGIIPSGSSLLIQNNMPQFTTYNNWELPDFMQAGFVPQNIVVDPYSYYYNHHSAANYLQNQTMLERANSYLNSGNYTIQRSMDGIVLLNRTGLNDLQEFVPLILNTTLTETNGTVISLAGNGANITRYAGEIPFTIPGIFLMNGTFPDGTQVSFQDFQVELVSTVNGSARTLHTLYERNGEVEFTLAQFAGPVYIVLTPENSATAHSISVTMKQILPKSVVVIS